jgi:hypothetical protein
MISFQVQINGQTVCTAGVGDFGVLTAILSFVRNRQQDQSASGSESVAGLQIGGLISGSTGLDENVNWGQHKVTVGDEIRIFVKDIMSVDEPQERTTRDPVTELERTKTHYEWLLREFDKEIKS